MEQIKQIAERLRALRGVLGKTEEQLAQEAGVSLTEYQRCERGESDFSFTFLHKCARALGVDITELLTGDMPRLTTYSVVRAGQGLPLERRKGFTYQHLASLFKSKLSEPFLVTARYEQAAANSPIPLSSHVGEEFDFVLTGTLRVQVGENTETLHAGDAIYYNAGMGHGMVALEGDCTFLAVVIDPSAGGQYKSPPVPQTAPLPQKALGELPFSRYATVTEGEKGELLDIRFHPGDNFNFAFDVVDELARQNPGKRAMLWVSKTKQVKDFSFADLSRESSRAASLFSRLGVKKGDRVLLTLKRHYQFWIALLGLHKLGAVAIPATYLLTEKDFLYRFQAAGVTALVSTQDGETARQAELAMEKYPQLTLRFAVNGPRGGWLDFDALLAAEPDGFTRPAGEEATRSGDPLLMYFTSGTTGYPKIAVHDHTYPLGHLVTARYWQQAEENGLHFTMADTGWGKAVWGKIYGQWLCGAPVFTYDFDKFDAHDILTLFEQYNITTFCAPPTIFRFFIKENLSRYNLSSLRHATIAGEALNPEVFNQFYQATGVKLMEGFGQTETTLTVATLRGMEPKPGSMGRPNPQYQVLLLGPDGPARPGEVGEIVLSAQTPPPGMFNGYYQDETRTAEVWHDGFYHTGDMAWADEDGYYWYVGRTDDVIKSSGYRIGPFEIESVIMELPYVLECAVTGVPDEVRGQLVKASIVLAKGHEVREGMAEEIQEYVKTHTAPYKYPRIVEFLPELPKTTNGKIRRVELRGK